MVLATGNSLFVRPGAHPDTVAHGRPPLRVCLLASLPIFACLFLAQHGSCGSIDLAALARKNFDEAQARYQKQPTNSQSAWQFGHACFELGEFATNSTERAEVAEQGIAACKQLLAREPNSAPGHYYLAMNLGQLARTRGIGALKIVKQMEREFNTARELDEHFDYAGPDRNLGVIYRDAPSLGSIGSRSHARRHMDRAIELAPDYPENRLNLIEACLGWSDRNAAIREWKS